MGEEWGLPISVQFLSSGIVVFPGSKAVAVLCIRVTGTLVGTAVHLSITAAQRSIMPCAYCSANGGLPGVQAPEPVRDRPDLAGLGTSVKPQVPTGAPGHKTKVWGNSHHSSVNKGKLSTCWSRRSL